MSVVTVNELTDTITLAPKSSQDAYGYDSYGAGTNYSARVREKRDLVRNPEGQEVVSKMQVHIASGASPTINDQLTLPSGDTPRILQIEEVLDQRNNTYMWKLWTE